MDIQINHLRKTRIRLEYCGVLFVVGLLYVLTAAPGPLWQDNGMAQVRVLQHDYTGKLGLALAHPLFYLFAQGFQILPLAESAQKTNLAVAVFAAITVANFYLLLSLLLIEKPYRRSAALAGGLSLALAHTFWQHAALAEVYSVSTAILTLELVLLVKFFQTGRIRWWLLAWLFNGLECSNHMLAVVTLAPVILWSLFLVRDGKIKLRWFLPAVGLWIVGCLPYEILGLRAWQAGMPLIDVIHSMLFGKYQSEVLNVGLSFSLIVTTLGVIALNFLTPNLLLIPAGMARAKKIIPARLVLLFGLLTGFHLLFAMRYPVRDQYTFFIISILFLALWLGIGAAWFFERHPRKQWLILLLACLPPLGYAFLPSFVHWRNPKFAYPPIPYRQEANYFFWPWKSGYDGPERLVREVFELADPNAVVIADSTAIRPFQYAQLAHNRRPDIHVVEGLYADLPDDQRVKKLSSDLKTHQLFIVRPYPRYAPGWILDHFEIVPQGPIYQVVGLKELPLTRPTKN
jgi:hypothetical protein